MDLDNCSTLFPPTAYPDPCQGTGGSGGEGDPSCEECECPNGSTFTCPPGVGEFQTWVVKCFVPTASGPVNCDDI